MSACSKPKLRNLVAQTLRGLSAAEKRNQSQRVFDKLLENPIFQEANRISIYLSTANEIDTLPIIEHIFAHTRKQCFIPFVWKSKATRQASATRMIMVELKSLQEYETLHCNKYGIKEFSQDLITTDESRHTIAHPTDCALDLVIVPGVAFSTDGRRLGHGMGYYDEFLTWWDRQAAGHRLKTIGLALREQMVDDPFAVDGHDYRLDQVLTG